MPLAASTDTEMFAERYRAYITIFNKAHHLALGKGMLLAADLDVADVARDTEGYEHDEVVPMEQALSFGLTVTEEVDSFLAHKSVIINDI